MPHQEHPPRIAADSRSVGMNPGHRRRAVFEHMGVLARWPEPVTGQHHQIAAAGKLPPDKMIVPRCARMPAAAVDEHQDRVRPRGARSNHFDPLGRVRSEGNAGFQDRRAIGSAHGPVGPIEHRHRIGRHGIAPGAE